MLFSSQREIDEKSEYENATNFPNYENVPNFPNFPNFPKNVHELSNLRVDTQNWFGVSTFSTQSLAKALFTLVTLFCSTIMAYCWLVYGLD